MPKVNELHNRAGNLFAPHEVSDWRPLVPPPISADVTDVGFDFETTGLEWFGRDVPVGLAVAWREGSKTRSYYLPTGHASGNLDPAVVQDWCRRELRGKRLFGSYLKFDAHMAPKWGLELEGMGCALHDVGHLAALLDDHRDEFTLEAIGQHYAGQGKVKHNLDMSQLAKYPAGSVVAYATQDAVLPLLCADVMLPELDRQGLNAVRDLEAAVLWPVIEMERNGAPLDQALLAAWSAGCQRDYVKCLYEIYAVAGVRISKVNATADVAKLFTALGIPITAFTAGSNPFKDPTPSFTDELLLGYISGSDERAANCLKKLRLARKLSSVDTKYLTKYKNTIRETAGILRYALHQLRGNSKENDNGTGTGTVTGRFSSAAIKIGPRTIGANIQQVPDAEKQQKIGLDEYVVRRLFRPERGLWLSADAMQIEYRLIAHYMRNPDVIKAYRDEPKTNFHLLIDSWIRPSNPDILYKVVKNTNFCKAFGGGPSKVAQTAGISEEAAEAFVRLYDETLPDVDRILREAERTAKKRGYVKTLLGRRGRFPESCRCRHCANDPRSPRYYKALNSVIQGSAADIMKTKLVELHAERADTGLVMRFTVHDEVDGDVPDVAAARKVSEILNRQAFDLRVPILWETSVGPSWADLEEVA